MIYDPDTDKWSRAYSTYRQTDVVKEITKTVTRTQRSGNRYDEETETKEDIVSSTTVLKPRYIYNSGFYDANESITTTTTVTTTVTTTYDRRGNLISGPTTVVGNPQTSTSNTLSYTDESGLSNTNYDDESVIVEVAENTFLVSHRQSGTSQRRAFTRIVLEKTDEHTGVKYTPKY